MGQTTIPKEGVRALLDLDWLQQNIRCQHRCPAHMDVPGYIRLISQGKYVESYKLMKETNPFPTFTFGFTGVWTYISTHGGERIGFFHQFVRFCAFTLAC